MLFYAIWGYIRLSFIPDYLLLSQFSWGIGIANPCRAPGSVKLHASYHDEVQLNSELNFLLLNYLKFSALKEVMEHTLNYTIATFFALLMCQI